MLVDTINKVKNISFDSTNLDAYITSLRGLSETQARVVLSSTNLDKTQQKQILTKIAETNATVTLTSAEASEALARKLGSQEAANSLLKKAGLVTEKGLETGVTIALKKELIEEAIALGKITQEEGKQLLTTFGLTGGNVGLATSFKLLGKQIGYATLQMLKWLVTTPAGWATLVIGSIAGAIAAYVKWGDTVENATEKLEESKQAYQEVKSELESVNSELKTTQDRIGELESKDTLTFTEKEELDNLKKQNNELEYQNDLLEEQNRIKNKEKNKDFVHLMDKKSQGSTYITDENGNRVELTGKDKKKYWDDFNITNYLSAKARHDEGAIDTYEKQMMERWEEYEENIEGIEYIPNPTNDDERAVNEWLDFAYDYRDRMMVALGGDGAKESAFNRIADSWQFDEVTQKLQDLGKEGKVTAEMLNDPKYDAFIQKLIDVGVISDDTEGSLRFVASAFNGTMQSAQKYVTSLKGNEINNFIKNLGNEAKALGTTESELAKLTAAHVIFNNTGLSTEQQQQALQMLAAKIATTSAEMKYLLQLFNYASGNFDAAGASTMTEQERRARTVRSKQYLKDKYGIDLSPIKIPEKEDVNPYTPSGGDKDKGKDNTPDYEDPTEAIINRINLRAKELEQQEESIQNAIEIAELENDYKKQISLTNDKLDIQRQKVDALKTANNELHQMAEDLRNSTPDWNEEEWFDSQGNATEVYNTLYNNSSKEEQEKLEDQFEKISKIKEAWVDNAEEIVDLNKEILQGEKEIVDLQNEYLEDTVSQIERHIEKIKEAKQDEIDKEEALLSIREKSYETLNKLAEAQHEADKAIRTSRIAYQYLDEDMISQIYNEDDYKRITDKINEVQDDLSEDTARFLSEVEDAYAQDKLYLVESITAEYERQCALKERELEILQAEIDLQKKQEQLNNVLAEKNVRLLKDGKWVWTHNADNARQAMEELADAQYEYERQQKEHQQQVTLDNQQRLIDGLTSEVSMLDAQVEKLNDVVENITDPLNDFSTLIDSIVSYGNKVLTDAIGDVHVGASSAGGSKYSSNNPAVKGSAGYYNSNPNYDYTNAIANAKTEAEVRQLNNERNNKIDQNGLSYNKMTQDEAVDYWKSNRGYASGTKHAQPGVADINENNKLEGLITNDGTLIPMANFAGGEMVFSHEMMENLWHHAQIPWNIHKPNLPDFIPKQTSVIEKGQSFYGDINVYNPTDWNDFMRELNTQTKSHNAITNKM